MVPAQSVCITIATIGITGLYAAWSRYRTQQESQAQNLRERVAYMLWVAATRT